MTFATKYRLSQLTMMGSMAGIAVSLSRMVPAGMAGDVHTVKMWFTTLVIFVVTGVSAACAFYYYRNRRFETKDQQQIAVETLANLGKQQRKDK